MKTSSAPPLLRVGFDMDGVLLYNPARIIRPIIALIKSVFLQKKSLTFYYPKSNYEKLFWRLVHKSSIYNAPGLHEISRLVKTGKIEAYLITARYNFLGAGVKKWVKKNKLENTFKEVIYNSENEQPHEFKERIIKKLKLDIYIEDNLDIVNHLTKTTQAKIFWIYNIFDRGVIFPQKYPHLASAMEEMKKWVK